MASKAKHLLCAFVLLLFIIISASSLADHEELKNKVTYVKASASQPLNKAPAPPPLVVKALSPPLSKPPSLPLAKPQSLPLPVRPPVRPPTPPGRSRADCSRWCGTSCPPPSRCMGAWMTCCDRCRCGFP